MNLEELIKTYNIVYINGVRYYVSKIDFSDFSYESTTPYYLKLYNCEFFEGSWKNLIVSLFNFLSERVFKSNDELLDIISFWNGKSIFSTTKYSNFVEVRDGFYINCNNTAIHAAWTVKLLFNEFGVSDDDYYFVLRRPPASEPEEVKTVIKADVMKKFRSYLIYIKKFSDESASTIIKNIDTISKKYLINFSKYYNDFFLFDAPQYFFNYMKKVTTLTDSYYRNSEKTAKAIKKQLQMLYDFIRINRVINKKLDNISVDENQEDYDSSLDKELAEFIDIEDLM